MSTPRQKGEILTFKEFQNLGMPYLIRVKRLSLRRGLWYKGLSRLERGLFSLSLKVTSKIRSRTLAKALHSIVMKLMEALESRVSKAMRQIGVPLAHKISSIAQRWGYDGAWRWAGDVGFIKYLTIMNLDGSRVFG